MPDVKDPFDLETLLQRESEKVEWKENVADPDDVAATLCAFANDLANLGGGYVVCGVREVQDEAGFTKIERIGLTANRLREIEGKVLTACRERIFPAVVPLVEEIELAGADGRRILIFLVAATGQAHLFRRRAQAGIYYVRIGSETREARNGLLRDLMVRKGEIQPWDHRPCATATVDDIDLLILREGLIRARLKRPDRLEVLLSDQERISAFVPPLCVKEPLSGILRPRNFAMLLFGRNVQQHVLGSWSIFARYSGVRKTDRLGERHDISGTLLEQLDRLKGHLEAEAPMIFDKADLEHPNIWKYPSAALGEALVNALAHRDFSIVEPTRIIAFDDRIEMHSPGGLPPGVSLEALRRGKAMPRWRNQALAFFLSRFDLAQGLGQGISTMRQAMKAIGCPPPRFAATETMVSCTLGANRRLTKPRDSELAFYVKRSRR